MAKTTEILAEELMKLAKTAAKNTTIMEALKLLKSCGADLLSVVDEKNVLIGALSGSNLIKLVKHEPSALIGEPVWFDTVEPEAGKLPLEAI